MSRILQALKNIDSRVHAEARPHVPQPKRMEDVEPESDGGAVDSEDSARNIDNEIDAISQQLKVELDQDSLESPFRLPSTETPSEAPAPVTEDVDPPVSDRVDAVNAPVEEITEAPDPEIKGTETEVPRENLPSEQPIEHDLEPEPEAEPELEPVAQPATSSENKLADLANLLKFNPHVEAESEPCEYESSINANLLSKQLADQYQRLANAMISATSPGVSVAVMCVSADETNDSADTISHVAAIISEQELGQILIIDCDVRSKTLTKQFERAADTGVAESLRGEVDWRKSVSSLSFKHVSFLAAGSGKAKNVAEISPNLATLLHQAKQDYQFVLIDAGYCNAPMPQILGRCCDLTYLLVELGQTDIDQARRSVQKLRTAGSRVMGCIVAADRNPHTS